MIRRVYLKILERKIESEIIRLAAPFPVMDVVGFRQVEKTTLVVTRLGDSRFSLRMGEKFTFQTAAAAANFFV
jgi:hypothetical protein